MSAMDPPPFVSGHDPKTPLKNRKTIRVFRVGALAQAMMKAMKVAGGQQKQQYQLICQCERAKTCQ